MTFKTKFLCFLTLSFLEIHGQIQTFKVLKRHLNITFLRVFFFGEEYFKKYFNSVVLKYVSRPTVERTKTVMYRLLVWNQGHLKSYVTVLFMSEKILPKEQCVTV